MFSARLACSIATLFLLPPAVAQSKSSLLLSYPPDMGHVPAVTFDKAGRPVGQSEFSFVPTDEDGLRMNVDMRISEGANNKTFAEFEIVESDHGGPRQLRMLREQSQSFAADGTPMTLLQIDHVAGVGTCTPPEGSKETPSSVQLPADDRVANVPMNLLFLPLVRGEVEEIRFQLFTCKGGARLHPFVAVASGSPVEQDGRRIVEIRYRPDLGQVMSWAVGLVMPRLSFWFDVNSNGAYMAHRMPLYTDGPDILMVRNGISPPALGKPY